MLIAAVQREYVRRYGSADVTPVDPVEFEPPRGLFLVGYWDGSPAACGGWRSREGDEPYLSDGDAEIKRMYVTPRARGRGLARALLAELERTAEGAGRRRMVLETGLVQPEAVGLYTSSGYTKITKFGPYRDSAYCVCYAKSFSSLRSSPGFSCRLRAPTVG